MHRPGSVIVARSFRLTRGAHDSGPAESLGPLRAHVVATIRFRRCCRFRVVAVGDEVRLASDEGACDACLAELRRVCAHAGLALRDLELC